MSHEKMHRVTRDRPCPVCSKSDWCLVASDGSAAICGRIKEGSRKRCGEAGYLHLVNDRHDGHDRHTNRARWRHTSIFVPAQDGRTQNFAELSAGYRPQLTDDRLHALARALGLSTKSLQRLRVGWDGRAYTFPMFDDSDKTIGIRRRFPNGRKASVKGSKTGLFVPVDLTGVGPLLLCEGPTDAAAALDLGFEAVGRPNCNSLVEMTVRALHGRDEIVIVADNDAVGEAGANRLAGALALCYPCVKIVMPPDAMKDLRQWLNAGLIPETLRKIIADTRPIRVKVSFSLAQTKKEVRR